MTKTEQALQTLRNGGYFRKALERSYTGGEKFVTRLRAENGEVVKGIGAATFYKLLDSNALVSRECIRSSAYAEEWSSAEVAAEARFDAEQAKDMAQREGAWLDNGAVHGAGY